MGIAARSLVACGECGDPENDEDDALGNARRGVGMLEKSVGFPAAPKDLIAGLAALQAFLDPSRWDASHRVKSQDNLLIAAFRSRKNMPRMHASHKSKEKETVVLRSISVIFWQRLAHGPSVARSCHAEADVTSKDSR